MRTILLSASLVVTLLLLTATAARAADPQWADGYPKAGAAGSGKILAKGTLNLAAPDMTTGTAVITVVPKAGGLVQSWGFPIPVANGLINWGEFSTGALNSGTEYNVFVQITIKRPDNSVYTLATATVVVKAP